MTLEVGIVTDANVLTALLVTHFSLRPVGRPRVHAIRWITRRTHGNGVQL